MTLDLNAIKAQGARDAEAVHPATSSNNDLRSLCGEIEHLSDYAVRKLNMIEATMFGGPEEAPTDETKTYRDPSIAQTLQRAKVDLRDLTDQLNRLHRALSASEVEESATGVAFR